MAVGCGQDGAMLQAMEDKLWWHGVKSHGRNPTWGRVLLDGDGSEGALQEVRTVVGLPTPPSVTSRRICKGLQVSLPVLPSSSFSARCALADGACFGAWC